MPNPIEKDWHSDDAGAFSLRSLLCRGVGLFLLVFTLGGCAQVALGLFLAKDKKSSKRYGGVSVASQFTDSGQSLGSDYSSAVALGDIDQDSDLDMVVANEFGGSRAYTNDGTGSFTDTGQAVGSSHGYGVALGDLDHDGDLDIVVASYGGGNQVYLNDGSGAFSDSAQFLGTTSSPGVALGDLDGDGDLDLVFANSNANRVYTND